MTGDSAESRSIDIEAELAVIRQEIADHGLGKTTPHLSVVPDDTEENADEPTEAPRELLRARGRCSDAFWESTDLLTRVRNAARAQKRSPEALLMNTAARVMAFVPPHVTFESADDKDPLSGNHGLVAIAPSGSGKSEVQRMAARMAPSPDPVQGVDGHPDWKILAGVTTGEGLLDEYATYVKDDEEDGAPLKRVVRATRVMVVQDELQALLAKMQQSNNTIGAVLSTLLQGGDYEMPNADPSRRRYVEKDHYRLVLSVGAQPTRLATLLATMDQGLAQRFFYVNAYGESLMKPDGTFEFGKGADLDDDELARLLADRRSRIRKNRLEPIAAHDGLGICEWAQSLSPQMLKLPDVAHYDMAGLLDSTGYYGVDNELNSHKPIQLVVLYNMLNLMHGQTQPSKQMWINTLELWRALEDSRNAFQRWALECERDRKRAEDTRRVRTAVTSREEADRQGVPPMVRTLMRRMREKAVQSDMTRQKMTNTINGKTVAKLKKEAPEWTKTKILDRAVYEGYLHEEGGLLLPGHKE